MVELGAFAFDIIINLIADVIYEGTSYKLQPFFERRRIKVRFENAVADVVEPLLPFLEHENIPEDKQYRLIETCVEELRPLTNDPEPLFRGSLDGQKIFEELYADRDLPQIVVEDDLKEVYTLLCPRIATLLCKIPAAVKDWENEAWSENYRRLDEITSQLRQLFTSVDELAKSPSKQADELLMTIRRAIAQKVRLELDLTGLRSDQPITGKFDDYFVHPELTEFTKDKDKRPHLVKNSEESLLEFVPSHRQNIIVGQPGAGKSTWTKWLQRETLTPRWIGISIRIELRQLSSEALPSLHELIRMRAGKHLAEEITPMGVSLWLDSKQVFFILDGFDEIRPSLRDIFYDWIIDLYSAARGCSFVLTSRPLTTDHLERFESIGWKEWLIEPFDVSRIIDYIQRWYAHTPLLLDDDRLIDAEKLATDWQRDPTLEPLTGNPLLLSTLLMVHHLDGSLPNGRSQLYRRYVEGMLGLWDARREIAASTIQLTLQQKRQILRGLALKLFFTEKDQLDEPDTLDWLKEILLQMNITHSSEDVLAVLRERTGLIEGPGIYSFTHKSIAEFLVAEAVLQGDQRDQSDNRIDRFLLFEHRNNDRWNTVLFLWAGLAPVTDVEGLIEECTKVGDLLLACGIINDQYDRFQKDIRRSMLLNLIQVDEFPNEIGGYTVVAISGPEYSFRKKNTIDDRNLRTPDFMLRGLVEVQFFQWLVRRAARDGTLFWSDQKLSKGLWRDYLWFSFAFYPDNLDSWKDCLESSWPKESQLAPIRWHFGIAENSFRNYLAQKKDGLEEIINIYQDILSDAQGLVPIALLSVGLEMILPSNDSSKKLTLNRGINEILKVLPDSDMENIDSEYLLGTRHWNLRRENVGDLLENFVERLNNIFELGYIEEDLVYDRAIEYVKKLHIQRETLETTQ